MAYDTSQPLVKNYVWLTREWTEESLAWSKVPVRIGLPAYGEDGVGYHHPEVENLSNSLSGLATAVKETNPKYLGWASILNGPWMNKRKSYFEACPS